MLLHENIHLEQQKTIGVESWWQQFLTNKDFRYEQELQAFAAQLAYGKNIYPVKTSDQMKHDFAILLSGKQYQTGKSYQECEQALRIKARTYKETVVK